MEDQNIQELMVHEELMLPLNIQHRIQNCS